MLATSSCLYVGFRGGLYATSSCLFAVLRSGLLAATPKPYQLGRNPKLKRVYEHEFVTDEYRRVGLSKKILTNVRDKLLLVRGLTQRAPGRYSQAISIGQEPET